MSRFGIGCDAWWKHFFQKVVPTHERVFDSNFIWLYHVMNELVNYLHILILGKFSLLIKPKFVLTPHNKDKKMFY